MKEYSSVFILSKEEDEAWKMVLDVSDLGPICSEIREIPDKIGYNNSMKKKHLHLRTDEEDNAKDKTELARKKKKKKNNSETEAKQFVTLKITPYSIRHCKLQFPMKFTRENNEIKKLRMITLLGKDGIKQETTLLFDKVNGSLALGKGWKNFVEVNGLKIGDSFTLKLIWENDDDNTTPLLSLFSTSKASEKDSASKKEPRSGNKVKEAKNYRGKRRDDSSLIIRNRFVTLTLTPEDVRACKLDLPSGFMRANGINKLGKITLLGEKGMKWFGYLLRKDGLVALGCGWKSFCEANGVKIGESFTLESIDEQDKGLVFKLCRKRVSAYILKI